MTRTDIIAFNELSEADLKIDTTYEGGTKGNTGDDPLSKLMGCGNQGGFRSVGTRNGIDTKLCILYSDLSHEEWPDRIDTETGRFYFYGDNRVPGRDIHKTAQKGNLILHNSYEELAKGNRKNIPPFFVFVKGKKGRDVVFRGLAVPGAPDLHNSEILTVITHEKEEGEIKNYQAIFTILDIQYISRLWIEDLHNGTPFTKNAPKPWIEWINSGKYQALKGIKSIDSHSAYTVGNLNPKYWLFNVYYASEPKVWKSSKHMDVAAMQYEYGREHTSSVTKHINLIKKISVGDYIVAYSGNKGFLGYGKVTKQFYEENDPSKFIHATGAHWKQRVGVNWQQALDIPIMYKGPNFMKDIGLKGSPVMSSSTIFEITSTGFTFIRKLLNEIYPNKVIEKQYPLVTPNEVVNHIFSYIKSKGFTYSKEEINNLFLAIKTKPFIILSGISGTGKTKIVQWLAESVGATEENGQFTLIPIRPDWNDGSDLLGYVDIKGEFRPGPLTKVIENAEKNPEKPYFVLLDEMNLARVEHYFSDILSVMESRKWKDGKMITTILIPEQTAGRDTRLPTNLYILGTVNMDETTHPFSKKVLDRAMTIEFNRVELANLSFLDDSHVIEPIEVPNSLFQSNYLHLKDLYVGNEDFVKEITYELESINKILQPTLTHFGYRIRDEITFYLYYNKAQNLMDHDYAFDNCILQKILPRLNGSDQRTNKMLSDLYLYCTGRVYTYQDDYQLEIKEAKYPKSAEKILEMIRRLQEDGFTSFWIS
ncbi:AAA family ATPase [Ferdinandcohnia sp. SAFN-114]|uniref:AAA family ATPase n=1 Tax=Ferdinandcohnia sp. SAFN-114 TaxID=3387275 RepID=UPI003F803CCD